MRMPLISSCFKILIFCFWIAIIGIFLLLPSLSGFFKKPQKSLTLFVPPLLLDPVYLKNFEKETGIKLYITYFENGATLLSKLSATGGVGYDIIIPDDHSLEWLIQHDFVKKIDKSKIAFLNEINPLLLNNYYDPDNVYSIPYYWGIYGIGFNSELLPLGAVGDSWSILFDKKICDNRICMTDDPREAVMIAAQYLFGSIDALKDPQAREQVKKVLINQKKHVEVYTLSRSDNLLQTKSCAVAAVVSPELWRLNREYPHIDMMIPREGSFFIIDAIAIPKTTRKDEMIYEFINYLYKKDVITHHAQLFGFCSPLSTVTIPGQEKFCPNTDLYRFDFFRNVISDEEINAIWVEVLAA